MSSDMSKAALEAMVADRERFYWYDSRASSEQDRLHASLHNQEYESTIAI